MADFWIVFLTVLKTDCEFLARRTPRTHLWCFRFPAGNRQNLMKSRKSRLFQKSGFWRRVEIQNFSSFVFQTAGIRAEKLKHLMFQVFGPSEFRNLEHSMFQCSAFPWDPGRKVETFNVSSFRAPGIPKLGTFNVPMFGFPPRFEGLSIDAWTASGGSGVNLQYKQRTVGKTKSKNRRIS